MGALVNEGESNKIRPRYENEFPEYKRHIKPVFSLHSLDRIMLMASFPFGSPSIRFSSKGAFSVETSSMSTGLERFVSSGSGMRLIKLRVAFHAINARRLPLAPLVYTLVRPPMTTSSANNSVFKGFFKKQKLTGPNFIDWYQQLRIVLSIEDKLNYLEHPIPAAPVLAQPGQQVTPEALVAHAAWFKGSKEIARIMLMTMETEIQRNLENLHAHEMLQELKTQFAQQAEQALLQTMQKFHSCKQEEVQSISSNVMKMKGYIDNLKCLGHPVSLGLGLNEQTLPKNNSPALHAIRAGKGKNKLAYTPKPKIPIPPKREDPAKDSICHECDGIFEIDLSNSCTNESSMFIISNKRAKLDLDSALLWHCHLGHISKKRIEKLQHDGLLNSTDLRAFEKCVPCMSGKMARKPYSHQVEKAKDILGLIHLDVCGPFKIMSRQGANYFITFTDDFSRYGYVYLLKHKHEVFETVGIKRLHDVLGVTTALALVKRDTLTKPDKLEPRSIKCIFIGCLKEMMSYSLYYPPENKVLVARNAKFLKNSLITQEASRSLEDLELIPEEDTHPSIDTSLHHEEDDLEIDEPQSDIVPIRRSIRIRHAPDRMCLYIDADEHELGDLGEPANYKAALLDLESDK
ncbi:retrotransposon protein, putative, ty1-copia subclass [Tanacetum coccineum]